MNDNAHLTIALDVLELAQSLDRRIDATEPIARAWAECFAGQKVWPQEARDAVITHYRKPGAWPIMPGDILAHCAIQPVYSSRDHAKYFLAYWTTEPYSDAIEAHTGIRPPMVEAPEDLRGDERKKYLGEKLTDWVLENHEQLVDAIMERRWNPVTE